MAFFTKFKKAKEAAIEHKKTAAAQESKPPAAPYKHIPTHAAQDALNAQPTTLKPAELQARIAAARKRRASSYQPPLAQRHSVYHSCESSRASSRAPSIAGYSPHSTPPSLKGKAISDPPTDATTQRPRHLSHRHSLPMASAHLQPGEYFPQIPEGPLTMPSPMSQRSRPPMSSRSSFAKKKSPLSNVSVDEEPEQVSSGSSDTSAASTQSSNTDDLQRANLNVKGPRHFSKPSDGVISPHSVPETPVRRRSKWSILPRKSMSIAAH
ncbi:hypothetical protein CC86DRAFT_144471 [Ophiobolus disseminans]|uniref:Uncharacterized protein n=1 Tax=Ophiobolus disseminans TaxID=1469910 RepID=A0A6A6ZE82_9PLEO|nr:hypothetical protein CC86DRAFT_144471 [Ophiobolus disseminans]